MKCALVFHNLVYDKSETTEQQAETRKCKCALVFHNLVYDKNNNNNNNKNNKNRTTGENT